MRWSWPAFASGVAVGVLLWAAWMLAGEPPPVAPDAPPARESTRPPPGAARTAAETAEAPRRAESPARPARRRAEEKPASSGAAPTAPENATERRSDMTFVSVGRKAMQDALFNAEVQPYVDASAAAEYTAIHRTDRPLNATVKQSLARARTAADRAAESGRMPDVDALLASSDDNDREAAIGAAMRADPPRIASLVAAARDAKLGGSLRSTALAAAAVAAPQDRAVLAAVSDLCADADPGVRRTAIELLAGLGGAGADRAAALLRAGDYDVPLLEPLALIVAASDRALDFLLSRPPPDAAFAVIRAIGATQADDASARARLLSRLPDAVRPLLRTPEMLVRGAEAFAALAAAGHAPYLRSVAVDTSLPTSLRLGAVDAAVAAPACAEGLASVIAATLSDLHSPVELLRAVVQRVPAALVADGGVKAALRALADDHRNAWLREEARAKLQASPPPGEAGALRIVSGVYGKEGHTVDVTAALASMVVGGRLVVEAGNALAGDPLFGTVKDLSVTYSWNGETRTRTIAEYETLTLP